MLRKSILVGLVVLVISLMVLGSFGNVTAARLTRWERDVSNNRGYEHGPTVEIDGEDYYYKGPGSIEGETDVPGHTWVQVGQKFVVGKHYNVGPWMAPEGTPWWATGEDWGVLLYKVRGIIDVPPDELPVWREWLYKKLGYIHFHEFVDGDGNELEDKVVYLKHIAVRKFNFNGGPMAPMSDHMVTPGVDYNFMPNW